MPAALIPADPVAALRAGLLAKHVAEAKTEAIAAADAELNNAGLPTYGELTAALKSMVNRGNLGAYERAAAMNAARALLARIPA